MELSNREWVGRGLELLARGLAPFVDRNMNRFQPGKDWLQGMIEQARRERRWPRVTRSDARLLLRVIEENRRVFVVALSPMGRVHVKEIREVANRWAHFETFTLADVRRALDTIGRLLREVMAADEASLIDELLSCLPGARPASSTPVDSVPTTASVRDPVGSGQGDRPAARPTVQQSIDNGSSLVEYRNRDADYLAWVAANPDGYVLNTGAQGGGNPRLHRAACTMITKVAPFTSRGYIKVCSPSPGALDQWTLDRSGAIPRRCGLCHPPDSHVFSGVRSDPANSTTAVAARSPDTAGSGWRAAGPSDAQREVRLWASRYIPFEKLSAEDLAARTDLRRRLRLLSASEGEILEASYAGPKPSNADVENLVLYNIDTADGTFRSPARHGVRFEMAARHGQEPANGAFQCSYRYRLIASNSELESWRTAQPLSRFDVDLGDFPSSKRLEQVWLAIHRAKSVVVQDGIAAGIPFALFLKLRSPRPVVVVAGPELVKALMDGATAAFQGHSDQASLHEVAKRISEVTGEKQNAIATMLANRDRAALGRLPKLAYPRGNAVQWNPGDHACMAGQVICEPTTQASWALSGQIFELVRR